MSKQSELTARMRVVAEIKEIAASDWEVSAVKTAFINDILHKALEKYAAHILKVAEEWCKEKTIDYKNEVIFRGIQPATHLAAYLKQYINGKAEVQG